MSSAVSTVSTLQQRSIEATHQLCDALELGTLSPTNLKYLALALTQVVTEEVARNAEFSERVRARYQSLLPAPPERKRRGSSNTTTEAKPWKVKLTPIGTADEALLDPYGPPNPFALQQIYGDEQLELALARYKPAQLKEAIPLVQQRYPGTKPKAMTKAAIIAYIVQTIAQIAQ